MKQVPSHPSRLVLDRIRLDDLPGDDERRVHVESCAQCQAYTRRMEEKDREFLAAHPNPWWTDASTSTAAPARPRGRAGWVGLGLAAAAAATALAAALLVVTWPSEEEVPGARGADGRPKGSSLVEMAVRRGPDSFPFRGELLRAGDLVAFRYTTERSYILIASLEASSRVHLFVPAGGERSRPIEPGVRVRLDTGIELDDYPDAERIFVWLTDVPLDVSQVVRLLEERFRSIDAAAAADLDVGQLPLEGEQFSWLIRKEAP